MKAPRFRYLRPATLEEALGALARHPGQAAALAGGQSLLPALNMRVAQPELLVDIGRLAELRGIRDEGGAVRIGSATRYVEIESDPLVARHVPLLPRALALVAHVAIRNRGTLGGSLALADPAAEMPACAVALGATVHLAGAEGRRSLPAEDFFEGTMATALRPGELIEAISYPKAGPGAFSEIDELSRRRGDYALAGLAVSGRHDAGLGDLRVCFFGCASTGRLAQRVANAMVNGAAAALDAAVEADIDPFDTPGCSAATRLRLARTLTRRMLEAIRGKKAA